MIMIHSSLGRSCFRRPEKLFAPRARSLLHSRRRLRLAEGLGRLPQPSPFQRRGLPLLPLVEAAHPVRKCETTNSLVNRCYYKASFFQYSMDTVFCRLCDKLHSESTNRTAKVIPNLHNWWQTSLEDPREPACVPGSRQKWARFKNEDFYNPMHLFWMCIRYLKISFVSTFMT